MHPAPRSAPLPIGRFRGRTEAEMPLVLGPSGVRFEGHRPWFRFCYGDVPALLPIAKARVTWRSADTTGAA